MGEIYIYAKVKEDIPEEIMFDCQQAVEDVLKKENKTIEDLKSSTEL